MTWKEQMEAHDAEEDKRKQQRIEMEISRRRAEEDRQEAQRLADAERMMMEHKRKFRCAIPGCKETSQGPVKDPGGNYPRDNPFDGSDYVPPHFIWDKPIGLERCVICGRWACTEHIHKERCMLCWQRYGDRTEDMTEWDTLSWFQRVYLRLQRR